MPAAPLGSIFEYTFKWSLYNQVLLTVGHLEVTSVSTAPDPFSEAGDIAEGIVGGAGTTFYPKMMGAIPSNVTLSELRVQAIYPTRWAVWVRSAPPFTGTRSPTPVTNMAAVLTRRGLLAGQKHVGNWHIVTGGATDVANGMVTLGLKTGLGDLGLALLVNTNGSAMGGIYKQVIFHKTTPNVLATTIALATPRDTVRTMHRRTVGLGI